MSWPYIIPLCFAVFVVAVHTSAYAFAPDKFPPDWYEVGGWITFGCTFVLWGIARA